MFPKLEALESRLRSVAEGSTARVDVLNELFWQIWSIYPERAEQIAGEAYRLAQELDYALGLAGAKTNIGLLAYARGDIEKAMRLILDALQWFEENGHKAGEANANHGLAFLYWGFGDFQRGFDAVSKALKIYEKLDDCDGKGWALNTLGSFYYDWKDYEQSLQHMKKSLGIFTETRNTMGQGRALNGIGNAYHLMGNHKKGLSFQKKSLRLQRSINNAFGESKTLNDIGLIFQSLREYDKALEYHQQSLAIRRELKYSQGETTSLLDIGEIFFKQGKCDQAVSILEQALELCAQIQAKVKISRAHHQLFRIYKELGQFEKALEHHEKYQAMHEEVYHEDNEKKLKNLRAAYQIETSQKETEIYRLKNVELKAKNEQLKQTLRKLNATQAQLIQSGKMVALGQLVAGVAHEINTPIGVIRSAADVIARVNDKAAKLIEQPNGSANGDAREELKSVLDILRQNNEVTIQGTERIAKIVQSLKNFSRLDEASFQSVDIHEGLESTLTLLQHDLQNGVTVQKSYGRVPKIFGYPSELNQVFMNIIRNGLQAIDGKGTLSIKTYAEDSQVVVEISDTGKGIPPDKIEHLFEPGFTEKESRIRMRTGLYTSYTIVLKHKGDIRVQSKPGHGTTFRILLPENLPGPGTGAGVVQPAN